jgi:hypothetical protein
MNSNSKDSVSDPVLFPEQKLDDRLTKDYICNYSTENTAIVKYGVKIGRLF